MNIWIPSRKALQRMVESEVKRQLALKTEEEKRYPYPGLTKETRICEIPFSARLAKCLNDANIITVADLCMQRSEDLLRIRNFGKLSLAEVREFMFNNSLTFGQQHK